MSDLEAVERVRAGDRESYGVIVRRYDRALYRRVRRILQDEAEAEDVLQDAHLRALMRLEQFAGRSSFFTWLARIAVNEALSRLRRRTPREVSSIAFPDGGPGGILASSTSNPEQLTFNSELRRALKNSLEGLPERYRTVFTMREIDDVSTAEAASRLGITSQCLKTRLHRARILLRKRLRMPTQGRRSINSSILYVTL